MATILLYGLQCAVTDEREVMRRINASLDMIKRTTSKATQKSLLDAKKPFTVKHYYWNQHRDAGVFFEVLQNQDLKGKWHRPDHQDKGLLLQFSLARHAFRDGVPLKKPLQYVDRMLRAVAVPYVKIAEGDELEDVYPVLSASKKGSAKVKKAPAKAAAPKNTPAKPAGSKKLPAKAKAPTKARSKP